jgi:uncharacterized membrane protein
MILTNTIDIAAPIERVWSLTEDIEQWPTITPTMTTIVRLDNGPLKVGSTARVKQPRQRARVWTVTRFDPNETFAWQSRILGMPVVGTHSMASRGDGSTANTLTLEMSGVMSRLTGRILASTLRQALATENAGFKQHAER